MASTIAFYTGDGATTDFTVPFDYLAKKFVRVSLGVTILKGGDYGDTSKDYYFLDKTKVRLKVPPQEGEVLTIRRYTSATDRVVSFKDASVLKATDLDVSSVQTIHIAEEARDIINDALIKDKEGNWDAKGNRIVNVGTPEADSDAMTYGVYKADALGAYQAKLDAERARDRAIEAETNSKKSEENAKLSEVNAQASAGTAVNASKHAEAVKVENQAILQEAKEIRDENKVLDANTKDNANVAQVKANEAKVSETNAKKSEVNSKESEGNAKASEGKASASVELAKQWATKLGATVDDTEYSAKYYANKANEVLTQGATDVINRVTAEGTKQTDLVRTQGTTSANVVKTQETASIKALQTEGQKYVDLAEAQANEATAKAGIATDKANAASTSATSAQSSATTATQQATLATTKAQEASDDADTAAQKAQEASASAANASASAEASEASATLSKASETASKTNADNAALSKDEATKQAERAKQYADQAVAGQLQADWAQTDPTELDFIKNKPTLGALASKDSIAYSEITGTPPEQDLSGLATKTELQTGLAGKANASHTHTIDNVTGLQVDLTAIRESITNVSSKIDGIGDTLSPTYAKKQDILDACDKALNGANPVHVGDPTLNEIKSALTTIQAQLGQLESRRYVKKTVTSSDGTAWYREWSDGWIEQGGKIPNGKACTWCTATLSTPFTTTSYTLVFGVCVTNDSSSSEQENKGYLSGKKSTHSFRYRQLGDVDNPTADWYACGY